MTGTDALEEQIVTGLRGFRLVAWVWVCVVAGLCHARMARPWLAVVALAPAGVVSVRAFVARRQPPAWAEVAVAALIVAADSTVYEAGRPQSLAGPWPLVPILGVAAVNGRRAGLLAAAALASARALSELIGPGFAAHRLLSVATTGVVYGLAAYGASGLANRIRRADKAAADAAARERVARELHDGVLQTLAAVQHRSTDTALVALARRQDADLRTWLAGATTSPGDLATALRQAAATATTRHGLTVDLAIVGALPPLPEATVAALAGAAGEALANAAKHAGVDKAVLYADVEDDHLLVTIRDNGRGFDPDTTPRRGLAASIEQRMREISGHTRVRSAPGAGTTIELRAPT